MDSLFAPHHASLLGLPIELRLKIYDLVIADDPITITMNGTTDGAVVRIKHVSPALRLKYVSRTTYCDSYAIRPPMSSRITYNFRDCSSQDFESWLNDLGIETISEIKRMTLETWAGCFGDLYRNDLHMAWCNVRNGGQCNFGCMVETDNKWVLQSRRGLCRRAVVFDLARAHHDILHDEALRGWADWPVEDQLLVLQERDRIKTWLCGHEFLTSDACRAECRQGIFEVLRLIVRNARGGEIRLSKPDLVRLFELLNRSKKTRRDSKRRSFWDMATDAAITMVENTIVGG